MPKHFSSLIIVDEEDYCIINKPSGYATLMDRHEHLSLQLLAERHDARLKAVHRIDKDTTGLLLYARSPEAHRHFSLQFENRKVHKVYHALADGIHQFENEVIDDPIEVLSTGIARLSRQGKDAKTIINTIRAYRTHTLLACEPVTGRLHQIRVHLAGRKAPLAGDTMYGGMPFLLSRIKRNYHIGKYEEEIPVIQRFALHARELHFTDLRGEEIHIEAPYPKDFKAALNQLEKNN